MTYVSTKPKMMIMCAAFGSKGCMNRMIEEVSEAAAQRKWDIDNKPEELPWSMLRLLNLNGWRVIHGRWVCPMHTQVQRTCPQCGGALPPTGPVFCSTYCEHKWNEVNVPRSKSELARMLDEFHAKFVFKGTPLDRLKRTRYRLMREEFEEYVIADKSGNRVLLADALADIVYVAFGTALCYGIDLDAVLREVHKSNMTKTPPLELGGKAFKGPGYSPPDLDKVLGIETR